MRNQRVKFLLISFGNLLTSRKKPFIIVCVCFAKRMLSPAAMCSVLVDILVNIEMNPLKVAGALFFNFFNELFNASDGLFVLHAACCTAGHSPPQGGRICRNFCWRSCSSHRDLQSYDSGSGSYPAAGAATRQQRRCPCKASVHKLGANPC